MDGCQVGKDEKKMASVKMGLENLKCNGTYDELKEALLNVKGIVEVDVDLDLDTVFIDYESDKITQQQVLDRIAAL